MEQELQFIPVDEKPFEIADFISLSQEQNWGIAACAIQEAWRVTKGAGIRVAVLDTGIAAHDDLKDAWTEAYNCSNEASYDDINSGHGTHVAGIIGARDNSLGVIGVAPECTLIPIKVLNNNGSGNFANIAAGIRKAVEAKADIISMSLGTSSEPPIDVHRAIREATNAGIIVLAAAGNDSGKTNYPARLDEVIAVAAIDENGDYAHFSSGDETVDSVAPGVNIYSTFLNNSYAKMSGTSQACPFVAGLCALILAHNRMNPDVPRINNYIDMMKAIDLVSDDSRYINSPGQKKWGFGAPKVGNIDWRSI
jgi:subtilisin family serine protease